MSPYTCSVFTHPPQLLKRGEKVDDLCINTSQMKFQSGVVQKQADSVFIWRWMGVVLGTGGCYLSARNKTLQTFA